jgi:hypothetical protein
MGMDIGHSLRFWAFEQHNRPMRTPSQSGRLSKEPPIRERRREIGVGLSFNHDTAVDDVIARCEMLHLHIEVTTRSRKIEQGGMSFRTIDAKVVPR